MTKKQLFRSLESITLVTSMSLCLSLIRGAYLKWDSLVEPHLTSIQPRKEMSCVFSVDDRMEMASPLLGLTGPQYVLHLGNPEIHFYLLKF